MGVGESQLHLEQAEPGSWDFRFGTGQSAGEHAPRPQPQTPRGYKEPMRSSPPSLLSKVSLGSIIQVAEVWKNKAVSRTVNIYESPFPTVGLD